MKNIKNDFSTNNNIRLFYQCWLPQQSIEAITVIVHGGGDHSGRFSNLVEFLVPHDYGIYIFDLRGHGRSPGKRGHINSWNEYQLDLSLFLDLVKTKHPDIPLFLLGHSMGGVIVLDHCIKSQKHISAIICSSPAIGELGISPFLISLARLINKIWPSIVLPTGLKVPHLSRDTEFIKKTKSDPLYHSKSTPRFGIEMLKTVEFVQNNVSKISLPIYLIHGTDDKIVSIEGSRRAKKLIDTSLITYKEYEDGYHELFNDLNKKVVMNDLLLWMKKLSSAI